MDQTIKEEWIDALGSGEYERGTGALRRPKGDGTGDQYCCLGVLCELAVKEGIIPPGKQPEPTDFDYTDPKLAPYYYGPDENDHASGFLPHAVMDWAGLMSTDPQVSVPLHERAHGTGGVVSLSGLNDSGDYTFQYIARFIGENF